MFEKSQEKIKTTEEFEAQQNLTGFFSVLLEVALRNPELRKKIFNENNEDIKNINKNV